MSDETVIDAPYEIRARDVSVRPLRIRILEKDGNVEHLTRVIAAAKVWDCVDRSTGKVDATFETLTAACEWVETMATRHPELFPSLKETTDG